MDTKKIEHLKTYITPRNVFIFGFLILIGLTLSEVVRGRERNFMIFVEATKMFWQSIPPYGDNWWDMVNSKGLDYFLYPPLFNIFFTPFAYLPHIVGAFAWNIFNYVLFYFAIFALPSTLMSLKQKCYSFLFVLPVLCVTQLSFQYNPTIAAIFLLSYSLLNKNSKFSAVGAIALILFSGFTKIYGIFQLALLICYPKFWRNLFFVFIVATVYILLPILQFSSWQELVSCYEQWIGALNSHTDSRIWTSIYYLKPFNMASYCTIIQLTSLCISALLLIGNYKRFSSWQFRTQATAIIMGWIILFGSSSEGHTYIIALIGYMLWYWSRIDEIKKIDNVLLWSNFILLGLIPIDVICPRFVSDFFNQYLTLNIYVFTFTWLRMYYMTFLKPLALKL